MNDDAIKQSLQRDQPVNAVAIKHGIQSIRIDNMDRTLSWSEMSEQSRERRFRVHNNGKGVGLGQTTFPKGIPFIRNRPANLFCQIRVLRCNLDARIFTGQINRTQLTGRRHQAQRCYQ